MSEQPESRLKNCASPYLRSAAHQPVGWYEWSEEAFARARAEDKPILLDIGAVWCHWCHVIDRESYENPEIAEVINRLFVPVKVDRDERPDVDARYQAAVSAISGQGGWPLTGFLTPDGRPFFGGTYFPPEDAQGRPGLKRVLLSIADAYRNRRVEVDRAATALAEAVAQAERFTGARAGFDARAADGLADSVVRMFDSRNGGFGQAPKFPHPSALDLLLERYQTTGAKHLLAAVETTLEKMGRGGVYDQLAGGFHRYSVDERWLVPHFEKMSYDNSELLKNYLHGFQVSGKAFLREVAEGIIGWVNQTLSDQSSEGKGGFYASQDADYSLEDDGDYFTWTLDEVRAVLAPDEARVIELYYDVEARGEMRHNPAKNVLWIARDPKEVGASLGISEADARLLIARAEGKMLGARVKRPTPYVDTTLYVSWNAMFISAYLEAYRVLGRSDCRDFALKTLRRILVEGWEDNKGFAHRIGGAPLEGMLDDQVFTAAALLDAYEVTLDRGYFQAAERAMDRVIEKHGDPEGGFFDRAADAA
ncbi:MAG TPA: thioredoxin domain-containing protein, partial [Candidatus Acidoferrales bacterium]|nr:thioredoxin domain-containing protein [Candidatus Acidoferrales bacterium]